MKRFFVILLIAFLAVFERGWADVFKDGETVCFLGDSITHGGRYHSFIYDYYLTRFPERTIRFVNAGVSGDSAGGAWGRLEEDVITKKPTSIAVMFGMNDVNRGSYVADPDAQKKAAQLDAFNRYVSNMGRLVERLRKEVNPRLVMITPSPFDQTAVNDRNNNQPGCNEGLARCAGAVRELAAKYNGEVVDFHGPMTAFNLERQKNDPAFTIVGPDRVHPGAPGHLLMAWLFLKAQGAPALVSKVTVDASKGDVTEAANATVSGLAKKGDGVAFTVLEKALPFPVEEAAKPLLAQVPVERDLNQEVVRVTGLTPGAYELLIDGTAVGRHSAEELAKGVNLAFNGAAPQFRQAAAVAKINESRRSAETVLRNHAAIRWFLRNRKVNPDDLAAVAVFAETKMGNKTGYFESKVPDYLKNWEKRGEAIAKVRALEDEALKARQPAPHAYEVRAVK